MYSSSACIFSGCHGIVFDRQDTGASHAGLMSEYNRCTVRYRDSFSEIFSRLFTNKAKLLTLTDWAMPVYFLGITVFGIQMACQSTFIALGQAKVILLIPLALLLPRFFGVMGAYYAEPAADIISVLTTAVLFILTMKKILRNWQK